MPPRGGMKKSTEERAATGKLNPNKHGIDPPMSDLPLSPPPNLKGLSRDVFLHYARLLTLKGMDNMEYVSIITLIAQTTADIVKMRTTIDKDGMTFRKGTTIVQHPLISVMKRTEAQLFNMLRSIGFTPDTRSKVATMKEAYNVGDVGDFFLDDE